MGDASNDAHCALVVRYYDACTRGDIDAIADTLDPDVVHYFLAPNTGTRPIFGREHLTRYWRKVSNLLEATWIVDHFVGDGDEAVVEWTIYWSGENPTQPITTRGSEWFVFRSGRIAEIRTYYHQRDYDSELDGFDYTGRGYSTNARRSSRVHPSPS